jgi:lipoprotein-anchoring transpeptidase ErfK/SrfK
MVSQAFVLSACLIAAVHGATVSKRPSGLTADRVNDAAVTPRINPSSKGAPVLRAQILLDRAHFSPGEMDALYGMNLERAIQAYRAANGLASSNTVDADMWAKLNADTAPAIQPYTLTSEDVSGPFTPDLPTDMMEQAKLPALNYANAQQLLSEKFHCAPALLAALNPGSTFTEAGETILAPNVLDSAPVGHAERIVVSKNRGVVQAVAADGSVLASFPATMGSEHDPLPIGEWKIAEILHNPEFHYNAALFWDATDKSDQATLKPGPKNPVGLVWMGLTKPHYGIHGTEDPHTIGHTTSHGCIRLANWDALQLAALVRKGTPVICQED